MYLLHKGIPAPRLRMLYRGKGVSDEKTLSDYEMTDGSIIHLVLALRV